MKDGFFPKQRLRLRASYFASIELPLDSRILQKNTPVAARRRLAASSLDSRIWAVAARRRLAASSLSFQDLGRRRL